jgi:hypothetical protein
MMNKSQFQCWRFDDAAGLCRSGVGFVELAHRRSFHQGLALLESLNVPFDFGRERIEDWPPLFAVEVQPSVGRGDEQRQDHGEFVGGNVGQGGEAKFDFFRRRWVGFRNIRAGYCPGGLGRGLGFPEYTH